MAFPSVVTTGTTTGGFGTSVALTMPGSITAGNLLLAAVQSDGLCTGVTGGWTSIGALANGSDNLAIFGKVAAGSDTGSATFSALQTVNAYIHQVSGWSGSLGDIGFASGGSSLNCPNLDMTTAADYLWVIAAGNLATAVTGAPANYGNFVGVSSSMNSTNLGVARRTLNASAEDPGAFSGTAAVPTSCTVAVPPVVAGGATPGPVVVTQAVFRASSW